MGLRCAGASGKLRRTCISGSSPQGARKVGDLYPSTYLPSGEGCFPQGRGGPSPIFFSCPTFRPNVRLQPSLQLSGGDMAGHRPHESVHPPCHLSTPPPSSMAISSRKPSLTSPRNCDLVIRYFFPNLYHEPGSAMCLSVCGFIVHQPQLDWKPPGAGSCV